MEDTFRVRVDKVFGSLGGEPPSSAAAVTPSLWCLTDEEIERREWILNKKDEEEDAAVESGPSNLGDPIESDLQQLSDDEEEEEVEEEEEIEGQEKERVEGSSKSIVDEDWDVQSNIGRDCTLDYEEEEDKYDKVAAGLEQSNDRIYMKDVKLPDYENHEPSTHGELPNTYQAVAKDPRADHMAATARLKEDAEAAGTFDTLQLSENIKNRVVVDVDHPKPIPILKKKETQMDARSQKRVRFVLENEEQQQQPSEHAPDLSRHFYDVPDYVKNPSKYTRYAFDDSSEDLDDRTNQKAFAEFFHSLRERKNIDNSDNESVDISKPVVFTPKRKQEDDSMVKNMEDDNKVKKKGWSIVVTAEDSQESEVCAMEEDEVVEKGGSSQKHGRQYRARITDADIEDNLT